jgi:hypothetical protein
MRAAFLAVLLAVATAGLAQSFDLPVEVPVSDPEVTDVGGHDQPRIATDGRRFLALWTDRRQDLHTFIYVARVDADGTVLDPYGIRVAEGAAADIVWTGRAYVVLAESPEGTVIFTIDADGRLLARHLLADYDIVNTYAGVLAANGTNVLLVTGGLAVRLDLDGRPYESMPVAQRYVHVAAASNGSSYLVSWFSGTHLMTQMIPSSGAPAAPVPVTDRPGNPVLAGNGNSYLLVWRHHELTVQPLDGNGKPAGPLRTVPERNAQFIVPFPRVAWNGEHYVIVHGVDYQLHETHVDAGGQVIEEPVPFALGSRQDVAGMNGAYAAVWTDPGGAVRAAASGARGRLEESGVLSRGVAAQRNVAMGRAGETPVMAWTEQNTVRIAPLGGEMQIVGELWSPIVQRLKIVQHEGTVWIAWSTGLTIHVRRYTTALVPIDPAPHQLLITDMFTGEWDIGAGENGALIAARQNVRSDTAHELVARLLRPNGAALQISDIAIAPASDFLDDASPAVAWNGSEYVVAWIHFLDEPWWQWPQPVPLDVRVVRVSREGVRIDPEPILVEESMQPASYGPLHLVPARDGGVAIVWQNFDVALAAIFRGSARPPVKVLGSLNGQNIVGAEPLPGGYAVFTTAVEPRQTPPGQIFRLSHTLDVIDMRTNPFLAWGTRATTTGNSIVLGYARPVVAPVYEGIPRAFFRYAAAGPRRRSAR